ncbi:MAG: hypothetical protein ACXQT5_04385 [Candidatus Syntropharchaeia archaeon]
MKKKIVTGLIVVVAIVAVATFVGCIEEDSTPTPTPTIIPTPTPTLTPTPIATLTSTTTPTHTSTDGVPILKSWDVIVDKEWNRVALVLKFDLKEDVLLYLLDPEGDTLEPVLSRGLYGVDIPLHLFKEKSTAKLYMTNEGRQVPQKGTWRLVVRDKSDENTLYTKDFTFKERPKPELVDIDLEWKEKYSPCEAYTLKIHSITVRNNGDLPVYLNFMDDPLMDGGWWLCRGFKWYFDSDYRSGWYNGIRDWVLPGKTKVIPVGAKISYNIPRDGRHHKLTMVVTDREGDIIIPVSITTPK